MNCFVQLKKKKKKTTTWPQSHKGWLNDLNDNSLALLLVLLHLFGRGVIDSYMEFGDLILFLESLHPTKPEHSLDKFNWRHVYGSDAMSFNNAVVCFTVSLEFLKYHYSVLC